MSKEGHLFRLHGVSPQNLGEMVSLNLPIEGTLPPLVWGLPILSAKHTRAPVELTGYFCPEGVIFIWVCEKCGGREEHLIDARSIITDHSVGLDVFLDATTAALEGHKEQMEEWAESHVSCNETPKSYTMPEALTVARNAAIETARMTLADGKIVPAILFLVTRDGTVVVPLDSVVATGHRHEREKRSHVLRYCVREMLRQMQSDLIGIVEIAEGWSVVKANAAKEIEETPINEHPDRSEALFVVTLTPDHGEFLVIEIERDGGVPGEGPGTLPNIPDPEPWSGLSRFSNGLFALDDPLTAPTGEYGAEA